MKFKTEEDIEEWLAAEKERIENDFLQSINKNKDNIPKAKEKFDAEMKRLLARYEAEHFRLMDEKK